MSGPDGTDPPLLLLQVFHCVHFECPAQCEVERHTTDEETPEPSAEPEHSEEDAEPEVAEGAEGGERRFSFELDKWGSGEEEGGRAYGGGGEP